MDAMRQIRKRGLVLFALGAAVLVVCVGEGVFAADKGDPYENSRVLKAGEVLPENLLSGPDYNVEERVDNDGFLNHYTLRSSYGDYEVVSTFALKKLIREIYAIAELKKIDTADTVGKSVIDSGKKTVTGIANLFFNPAETLEGAAKGAGSVYKRAKEAVSSKPSEAEDSRVEQLIGFSKSKREVAAKVGVDVYSTNEALQSELDRLAWADYAGGIGVSAGLAAVPGGAGVLLSVSGGTRLLNETINTTPPTELRHQNRQKLSQMGMDSDTIDLFINNAAYSPRHQTWLVAALEKMKGASNRELFLKVALQAHDASMALVVTQIAMMFAGYHTQIGPLDRFYPIARFLYGKDKAGKVVLMVPADYILWSERLAGGVARIHEKAKGDKCELWTAGGVSKQASENLTKAGWAIHTNAFSKFEEKVKR